MQTRIPLDLVKIENPCPADWNAMTGDDRSRFCAHCQKHVHDLSQMSLGDAERLVCESAGSLCVRMHRDEAGKLITLDYEQAVRRRWTWKILAPLTAIMALGGGWINYWIAHKPAKSAISVIAGKIAPPSRVLMGDVLGPTPQQPAPTK